MKKKLYLIIAAALLLCGGTVTAQQPYGGCWHPDDIKDWSPDTDADAKFNRSRVPLADRFKEPTTMKANENQYYEGQICDATILFPTCSACPSQGADNFLGYQPTYWQYMDKLVYWAGSASEGIIIPPPAGSTDAAHQSGVKSIGQIFFPPAAYGGNQSWVRQMLTQEDGKYIYAIKLYEIAKYFGFDGWFINEETGGGSTSEWVGFIQEFNAAADADGNTQMEIQWYNASSSPNTTILTSHKNTSQFLEYGSPGDYRSYAETLGCTEEETFSKIYAGVQTVYSGHTGYTTYLNKAMPTTGHVGSLDLFCPEERIWKDNVSSYLGTKNDNGEVAYEAIKKTFDNEEDMWVNLKGDPSYVAESGWPGLSGRMVERSAIQSMPFVSSFCVGVGKHRFVEGVKKGTQDWYHSGMQSVMPTWRWWIENRGDLTAEIDWDDAYNSGSSMKFSGTLTAGDHLMRLYKTQIGVTNGGVLRLVYKTSAEGSVEAVVATQSSTTEGQHTLAVSSTSENNGWTVADYDLASLNGDTIYMVALNLKADAEVSDYTLSLGELSILPANYAPAAVEVSNLATTSTLGEEKGDVRLTWDWEYTADFDHFNIYIETADGTRTLVGQTRDEAFYIPEFERNATDEYVNIIVVPVMKDMKEQSGITLKMDYPELTVPVVTFKLSKSYINVGDTATITAKGTGKPSAWQWELPSSLELVGGSLTENVVTVKGLVAGKQSVTVYATNTAGTSKTTREVLDVFEGEDINGVENVVLKKTVVDYNASTNSTEVPEKIIDGVTNPTSTSSKWCNVGADNWVIFDCEGAYRMYGFRIYDGNAGPESGVDQISDYTISLSQDGENWTAVVDESDAEDITIKTDYIAPTKARYIRLDAHVSGTLRIWEFEAYGMEDNNMTVEVSPTTLSMNAGETKNITMKYNLNGDERASSFTCTATAANENVTIGEITESQEDSLFTIPVTANRTIGEDKITVTVNNGGAYKERTVGVTIDSDEQPNVLSGMDAELRHYEADYSYEATYKTYTTTALTDGNLTEEACSMVEDPSTHKQDFWAIFTAPEDVWNLAKVKVYLPNNNQGENDNGNKGSVNNEISIMVGNDLTNMTAAKTFSNLSDESEFEYIFPEYKSCKYLAIACTLNAYYYPSLAEVEAYEQFDENIPVTGPVSVSGWNADVIAESTPSASSTTATLDDQGWVLYSSAVQEAGSIAGDSRIVTTSGGLEFKLADYASDNALVMKTYNQKDTLTFDAPANCEEVYFLVISANGQARLVANVIYTDGTTTDTETFRPSDWYGSTGDVTGIDRIITAASDGYSTDQIDGRQNFQLFAYTITTDKSKKVKSIVFQSTYYGRYPTILGVSKKGYTVATGIEKDVNSGAESTVTGIYTVNGVKLNALQRGINIVKYSDGTVRKVLVK